jgi:hypothetical protein
MKFSFEVQIDGYRFDAVGHESGIVASVELKNHLGSMMCDWWISGLNATGELVALARLEFGMGEMDEHSGMKQLPQVYARVIAPMVEEFQKGGGLPSAPNPPSVQTKVALCKLHLDLHKAEENIGDHLGIRTNVARQYQLIKSFGLKAARPLIAEREGLPVSTISRRLYLAREAGILAKMSDADDINS